MKRIYLFARTLLCASIIAGTSKSGYAKTLDEELPAMAGKVGKQLVSADGKKKKIAIIDVLNLQGQQNELGRSLAEQLSVEVVMAGNVSVVDRANIDRIMQENKFARTLANPDDVKKLGQIAGLDAIAIGTVNCGDTVGELIVKVISIETAELIAVGRCKFDMTQDLSKQFSASINGGTTKSGPGTNTGNGAQSSHETNGGAKKMIGDSDKVLVDVGGAKLTVAEADRQVKAMLGPKFDQIPSGEMDASMRRYRQQAVQGFIVRTLLSQEAGKRKYTVSDKEVDAEVALIKTRLPEGKSLEDILKSEGMTLSQLRSDLTAKLRIDKLLKAEVPANDVVSDEEISKFYKEQKDRFSHPEMVKARHILIKVDASDDATAKAFKKAKIEAIRKQLVEGGDFGELALANSDCPSKEHGGDLGFFPRGQMVKEFEGEAFSQTINSISPVVETQFGYHVIQVIDHQDAKNDSLESLKPQLVEHIKQTRQKEVFDKMIERLKQKTTIIQSDV